MIPKRKLSEVIARIKLAPCLDDVFVEGDKDKRIIDIAHKESKRHRPVYSISSIDIPGEVLTEYGLTEGNRQRVMALCLKLELKSGSSVRCLVDTDKDGVLNRKADIPGLRYTTFTDMEGAFLSSEVISSLVVDVGRAEVGDWEDFFPLIERVVKLIFCVRLALEEMKLNVSIPVIEKSFSKSGNKVSFDLDAYLKKLASSGLGEDCREEVKARSLKWFEEIRHEEARMAGRGHDYFELISWVIKRFGGQPKIASSLDDLIVLMVPKVIEEILEPLN